MRNMLFSTIKIKVYSDTPDFYCGNCDPDEKKKNLKHFIILCGNLREYSLNILKIYDNNFFLIVGWDRESTK